MQPAALRFVLLQFKMENIVHLVFLFFFFLKNILVGGGVCLHVWMRQWKPKFDEHKGC